MGFAPAKVISRLRERWYNVSLTPRRPDRVRCVDLRPVVRSSSLNYRDPTVLKGGVGGPTEIGVVVLFDGADEIAATSEAVTITLRELIEVKMKGRLPNSDQ